MFPFVVFVSQLCPAIGAVYVFSKNSGGAYDEQKVVASDGAAGDEFGWSVSIYGDIFAVGAYRNANSGGIHAGVPFYIMWSVYFLLILWPTSVVRGCVFVCSALI